jgi:hypothetical protein
MACQSHEASQGQRKRPECESYQYTLLNITFSIPTNAILSCLYHVVAPRTIHVLVLPHASLSKLHKYIMLTSNRGENGEVLNGAAPAAPKLGPKANQGAINACLRALDRTGKPCRRWVKKPFAVRSFTGYNWGAGAYASSRKPVTEFEGDVKSDTSSSGDLKQTQDSSAIMSEKSISGADADTPMLPTGMASSPAPAVTVNASG